MIFVTVGNATQSFRRLLDSIEGLAVKGFFGDETIFVQSGRSVDFKSTYCVVRPVLPPSEFLSAVCTASLVICHGGAGTLIEVLRAGKRPVTMPRRLRYGEHVDDHQVELVDALARNQRVIPAFEVTDLPGAILEAGCSKIPIRLASAPAMLASVANAIAELAELKRFTR